MSSTSSPRASLQSDRVATNNQATPTLPSKFRVPPLPPQIHRRLYLKPLSDGLIVTSHQSETPHSRGTDDVWIGYGPKGQVKRWKDLDSQRKQRLPTVSKDDPSTLEIGGILGLTRLWETSYLIVFLSTPKPKRSNQPGSNVTSVGNGSGSGRITLFPPESTATFPSLPLHTPSSVPESDPLIRGLRAIAEREGLLSPDGRLNPYSPRAAQQDEEADEGEEETHGERVVYELRNVYALPLVKDGAEGVIKTIKAAIAKNKPKSTAPTHPAASPATTSRTEDQSEPETPAQILARALNPARWNLGLSKTTSIPESTSGVSSSSKGEVREDVNAVVAGSGDSSKEEISGDLGETMLRHSEDEPSVPAGTTQKPSKADGEEHFDAEAGLPDPDQVMGQVPETMKREEKRGSFMNGLKVDWSKMNLFKQGQNKPTGGSVLIEDDGGEESENTRKVEAQVPGVIDEQEHSVEVDDGMAKEEPVDENVHGSTATAGQRKDLEVKIVREIVRVLSGGGFFYSFETDLSHNLQHKRNQLSSRSQATGLLSSLLQPGAGDRTPLDLASGPTSPGGDLAESPIVPSLPVEGLAAAAEIKEKSPADTHEERQERGETWVEPDIGLPLWRRIDPRFMWNAWMMRDFIDAGLHEFILPVIQGWVQASRFYVPPTQDPTGVSIEKSVKSPVPAGHADLGPPNTPVDIVLISRRSRDRAGLRFQRRGIDEDGNVANFVETEMIVRIKVEGKWSIFSFVEIRGSIPLFWSQNSTLTDMKPAPKLDRPVNQSTATTRLHFEDLKRRYGPQTIVNLAETSGKEGAVTVGYRDVVKELDDKDVRYQEFDFHHECKGMKYENISKLITQLSSTFSEQGYFWTCQGEVMREQTGTFRVNCIDCLDRTNVVESALARHILTSQLTQVGITPDTLTSDIEFVYNDAWANNGDQISKLYAGTSALKGDFTRTGKRDLHGMINDGLNSVARMRRGAIEDFYLQAVISFMVGERNLTVFSEVLSTLSSNDRSNLMRLSRIRAAAIETCSARVLEEGETRINGWTVFSPEEVNTRFTRKLEEKVLILTHQALYVVSFDYDLEKVVSSTRIPLRNITSLTKGAYILSALEESGRDPAENSGFVLHYRPSRAGTRITSYSMANSADPGARQRALSNGSIHERSVLGPSSASSTAPSTPGAGPPSSSDFFAFKVLPREFVTSSALSGGGKVEGEDEDDDRGKDETCKDVTDRMVRRIKDECVRATGSVGGYIGGYAREETFVREEDVVGLAEAQKATSLVARADYALKRFLWMP